MAMAKDTKGLCPIVVAKVFLWLIRNSIVLHFRSLFKEHLSPHQFGISTFKGCETIPFGIKILLDLHLAWIMMQVNVKTFLLLFIELLFFKCYEMLKDLWQTLSLLTKLFYDVHSFLYYRHGQHEEGVIVI